MKIENLELFKEYRVISGKEFFSFDNEIKKILPIQIDNEALSNKFIGVLFVCFYKKGSPELYGINAEEFKKLEIEQIEKEENKAIENIAVTLREPIAEMVNNGEIEFLRKIVDKLVDRRCIKC